MSEFIMSFVNPLIEKLIDPLLNHLSYIICVGGYVKSLEDKVNVLKAKKKDVKDEIQRAERYGKEATDEVRGWLVTVEKLEEDANSISNKYRNRNCMFHGTCSLNCFLNYSIGGEAVEVKEKVEEELRRRDGYKEITKEAPPPVAQPVPITTLPEVSRAQIESMLGEALNFLRNDGESILGIWGMGGVGKTTLLERINNALAKDPISFGFDRVILVTASREWTVETMQKLISKALKLPEEGNHYINIFNYLNHRSFVILLDDLWRRMDLKDLGIPSLGMEGTCKCKLILTTRSQQACHDMETHPTIKVHCLIPEVARLLFRAKVGEETINSHPLIPDLADKVADECDGLPMALICIARAMAGQQRVNLWEKAIEDLKKSKVSTIRGIDDPLPLLKFSYDYLNDHSIQECLLLCALWPEDYKIPKDKVIECWMGHGLLGEFDTIDEANNKGGEIIDVLEKASLLEWGEIDIIDYDLAEGSVKLHDLIRDMALWIARDCGKNEKKWVVLDRAPQDEKSWREAQKMLLMGEGITTLPSSMGYGSNLITLILLGAALSHRELGILQNLHLLKYLDLSRNKEIRKFPTEICQLFTLEYLNLSHTPIDSLPDELQGLKNLKYLLLRSTSITEVSRQLLSSLVSLEVLDLFGYYSLDHPISHSLIMDNLDCMQGRLKSLGINLYTESDLRKLSQLSSTIHIKHLCIQVRSAEDWTSLHAFPRYDLSKVDGWIAIDGLGNDFAEELVMEENHLLFLKILEIIWFNRLKEIIWQRVEQRETISSAIHTVHINSCIELKHVSCLAYLPVLESLVLAHCYELKHVVCWEEEATSSIEMEGKNKLIFPALKVLFLVYLNSLETICNHTMAFPSLEILKVQNCGMLRKLPFDSPTSCSKLKKIECDTPEWWDSLDIGDDVRASLKPSFRWLY